MQELRGDKRRGMITSFTKIHAVIAHITDPDGLATSIMGAWMTDPLHAWHGGSAFSGWSVVSGGSASSLSNLVNICCLMMLWLPFGPGPS
jgi:hypothetical protein